ncbi:4950_t:CDS:10 [Paraglomus brasilianum]|uniref:4950_t:CDS:1 n=1 Tax=Paraglomus brasilianum TaxID=144538 RepID=A0A9N9C2R0_9GLOM|nr:4950_t:CDS:10 [Paraglomus brasilianum]
MAEEESTFETSPLMIRLEQERLNLGNVRPVELTGGQIKTGYEMSERCWYALKFICQMAYDEDAGVSREVLCYLSLSGILETDLIPIFLKVRNIVCESEIRMVLACVGLFDRMTDTVWLTDRRKDCEHLTDESKRRKVFSELLKLQKAMIRYKSIFANNKDFINALEEVVDILLRGDTRSVEEERIVRHGMLLFRNLLAIKDNEDIIAAGRVQSELIHSYYEHNVFLLISAMAASSNINGLLKMTILEILYYIYSVAEPEELIEEPTDRAVMGNSLSEEMPISNKMKSTKKWPVQFLLKTNDGRTYPAFTRKALNNPSVKILDYSKKKRWERRGFLDDLDQRKMLDLSPSAKQALRKLGEAILNMAFHHIKHDIEYERPYMKNVHVFYAMYVSGFFLGFQRFMLENDSSLFEDGPHIGKPKWDIGHVAFILNQDGLQLMLRKLREVHLDKKWVEVHIGLHYLKQMLLSLRSMSKSSFEFYPMIARQRIAFLSDEQANLDLVVDLIKNYKEQSFGFLKLLVEVIHLLVNILEEFTETGRRLYTKQKMRKKKKRNKGKKKATENDDENRIDDEIEEEQEGERDDSSLREQSYAHMPFELLQFQMMFANEAVVKNYLKYLEHYHELDAQEILHAASVIDCIINKCHQGGLFFRPSTFELFERIMSEPLKQVQALKPLITQIMRLFVQKADDDPLSLVEALFPKRKADAHVYVQPDE